jgi:hypothetical protein
MWPRATERQCEGWPYIVVICGLYQTHWSLLSPNLQNCLLICRLTGLYRAGRFTCYETQAWLRMGTIAER